MEKHFHNLPEFRELGKHLVMYQHELLNERMLDMICETAETRYEKLISNHSRILQNVPLKIIASYLGITDTSLSRIRKEFVQKKIPVK